MDSTSNDRLLHALRQVPSLSDIEGPSAVARALGLEPNVVTNWKSRGVSKPGVLEANRRYGVRVAYIEAGIEPMFEGARRLSQSPRQDASSRIPVIGEARLGDQGFYVMEEFERGSDGYLEIDGQPGDYALRCFGDSMRPTIKPGQYVVVKPGRAPKRRDTVMCETKDGRRMIKILNDEYDNGMVELTSINEDVKPITLDRSEIDHLFYAVGPIPADLYQPTTT